VAVLAALRHLRGDDDIGDLTVMSDLCGRPPRMQSSLANPNLVANTEPPQ